ncbi:hypothetical protein ACVITL_006344 [Rhizobium pisi]
MEPTTTRSARSTTSTALAPEASVVIDVGGFLGIGAKPVAVPISDLEFMRDEDGDVHAVTNWTKDELKNMPEHRD